MTTNHLSRWHFIAMLLLCLSLTGCSTKVQLTTTNSALFPNSVDLGLVKTNFSKIVNQTACCDEISAYNCEVRQSVNQLIPPHGKAFKEGKKLRTKEGKIPVRINHSQIREFERIDRIHLADTITVIGGIDRTIISDGAGVPLLARMKKTGSDPLIPDGGVWIPLTAVIDPCGNIPEIRLIDTDSACGCHLPVASNFTAPLARDLHDRQKEFQRARALINFDKYEPEMGIRRVFGFHPGKIPVVFVHGIFSSTSTWADAINELMADQEIRKSYEFWSFNYPTGAPVPHLAHELRESVREMQRFRSANGSGHRKVIMVGHSMGALMSKILTQRSGDEQWNRFFEVPPDELEVSDAEREILRNMFYFEPLPCVDRVICMATPHRGAEVADRNLVQSVETIIRTPGSIIDVTRNVLQTGINVLTPLGLEATRDFPNSIQHMEYESDIGEIFADIPLNPAVKYHSIIGSEEGLNIPKEEMTDGVVTYQSAHLRGVVSEKIIHSDHSVQHSGGGIAEIARILKSAN